MENFTFYAPTYFAFGDGAESKAGELAAGSLHLYNEP